MKGLPIVDRLKLAYKAMTSLFDAGAAAQVRSMLGGIYAGTVGPAPKRNTYELLQTVNDSPWIRACAGRMADANASTTWTLSVAKRKGEAKARKDVGYIQHAGYMARREFMKELSQDKELTPVREHIFLDAMRKGNSMFTGLDLQWLVSIYYDMVGDVFLLKQRGQFGKPVAFWPIPPHWIAECPTPARPYYRAEWGAWHAKIDIKDVMWLKNPDPVDPYDRGVGTARSLDDDLAADEYAAKHQLKFFKNGARPDMLIMPAKDAAPFSEVDRDRFEQHWNQKVGGFWRSFKPLFLKSQVEVTLLEQNFRNFQMKELREHERNTIIQVWGIPPEMFGIVASSNRSTIDMAPFIFAKYGQVPRLERQRAFYQERLIEEYDERLILDYVSPIPQDRKFQLECMKAQPQAFQLNEMRSLAELPMDPELEGEYGQEPKPQVPGELGLGGEGDQDPKGKGLEGLSDEETADLFYLQHKLYS